jgi:hypothetical protein
MSLFAAAACGDDGEIAGSGTGGDEMPDDHPGPGGPGCAAQIGRPSDGPSEEGVAQAQPAIVTGLVAFRGDSTGSEEPLASSAVALSLTAAGHPTGATTKSPHIHERWSESRKLELSYCITAVPGDDAEKEDNYHKVIRSLVDTTAEWERVTGANFVHVATDDTPHNLAYPTPTPDGDSALNAECAAGA